MYIRCFRLYWIWIFTYHLYNWRKWEIVATWVSFWMCQTARSVTSNPNIFGNIGLQKQQVLPEWHSGVSRPDFMCYAGVRFPELTENMLRWCWRISIFLLVSLPRKCLTLCVRSCTNSLVNRLRSDLCSFSIRTCICVKTVSNCALCGLLCV